MNGDEVSCIGKEVIEKVLGNEFYKHSDVSNWNNSIVEQVIQKLISNCSNYKYIASSVIVQKNGAGIGSAASCYWNNSQDKQFTVRWENKHLHCILNIFIIPL